MARALDGRRVHRDTTVIVTTSPEIKHAADRMGLTQPARSRRARSSRRASASTRATPARWPRPMAGRRLMTNSAKLVNIIGGYGYRPTLASLERCVDSAVAGRVP